MKTFIQYGAGNIGRGFIGQIFSQGGYHVKFIDVNESVINAFNTYKKYPVTVVSDTESTDIWIENIEGIDGQNKQLVENEIADADIMATAVGVNILPKIIPLIAGGITKRFQKTPTRPLDIIICENLIHADKYLRDEISKILPSGVKEYFNSHVGLVEASIGRMVPVMTDEMRNGNILRVCVESYSKLPVDKDAFKGDIPNVPGLIPCTTFDFYIRRKLYIHNMGHALTAYLGNICGFEYIWQAISVPEIKYIVERAMTESAFALSRKYDIPLEGIMLHIHDLLHRFSNKALGDTVLRVGNDIARKLAPGDRFAGTITTCIEQGITPVFISIGVAAALFFKNPSDLSSKQIFATLDANGPGEVLQNYCGLDTSSEIAGIISRFYDIIKTSGSTGSLLSLAELISANKTKQDIF